MKAVALLLLWLLAGCEGDGGPALTVEDVRIYAPLPGAAAGVAYLTLGNRTGTPITVRNIRSPQFGAVEMHRTEVTDGVARMRPEEQLTVPANGRLRLEEGGRHLMLRSPAGDLSVGDGVTLYLQTDGAGEIIVSSALEARLRVDPQ